MPCAYPRLTGPCRPRKIVIMYLKSQPTLKNPWPSLTLPQPLSLRYERAFHRLIRLGCLPSSYDRTRRSLLRPNPPPSPRLRNTRLNSCLLLLQPLALRWVLLQSRLGLSQNSSFVVQEEPTEDSVVEAAGVPPLPKEGATSLAANGDSHPDKGLPGVVVPEVWLDMYRYAGHP